jgi:methionyl-tRNA formyltransferase
MPLKVVFCGKSDELAEVISFAALHGDIEVCGYVLPKVNSFTEKCLEVVRSLEIDIFDHHKEITIRPDCIVSMYYDRIFLEQFIENHFIVNLHNSLLPMHRGVRPIEYGIKDNDSYLGCTLHIVDSGIDTGPIISQSSFKNDANLTKSHIYARCRELGKILLIDYLKSYPNYNAIPQDLTLGSYHSRDDAINDNFLES